MGRKSKALREINQRERRLDATNVKSK